MIVAAYSHFAYVHTMTKLINLNVFILHHIFEHTSHIQNTAYYAFEERCEMFTYERDMQEE